MKVSTRKFSILPIYVGAFFLFLYIPIIVLVIFSFNAGSMPYEWSGFSVAWYKQLFACGEVWLALKNSLIVAFSSVVLSVTLAVLLIYYGSRKFDFLLTLFYGSLVVPEIVLAVGMLGFFSLFSVSLGYVTLIAGHTLLGLGYAIPIIHARYNELGRHLTEASLDLGATITQTFFRIIFPLLIPALFASSLLIFVISMDDFLIAFFCAGAETQTLPLYIFTVVRSGGSPMINALSTVLLVLGSLIMLVMSIMQGRKGFFFGG